MHGWTPRPQRHVNNHPPASHTTQQCKGRIVTVSSVAGVSCGYPLSSPYAASKHAVEVFTSSLRQELRPWGIKVRPYPLGVLGWIEEHQPVD